MRQAIALAIVVSLVSGLAGAWASGQLSGSAGAAPPPPGPQQVREQNLDGNGFIRVHEQGTANVNVANLPTDGEGNIRVSTLTADAGRVVLLGENVIIPPFGSNTTEFVEISDCERLAIFAKMNPVSSMNVYLHPSPDGILDTGQIGMGATSDSAEGRVYYFNDFYAPFVAVEFSDAGSSSATVEKAWLFCSH